MSAPSGTQHGTDAATPTTTTTARPQRIDQALHILAHHDAIGTHVIELQKVLWANGYESDIWVGAAHPEVAHLTKPVGEMPANPRPGTWLVFHHSTGSAVTPHILARREPLLLDYHNVTPVELVERWVPEVRDELQLGIDQLAALAPASFFGVAHSRFSERELAEAGCPVTAAVPPLFDPRQFDHEPDAATLAELAATKTGADWLFVGRVSPHKAQHDLVKALAWYRERIDPGARLHLIGTSLGADYPRALERFSARLGLGDAVRMVGPLSSAALSAYYRACDVFVCASDHEGFCVPLVEAMHAGLPVVAYDAAAVAETVGSGGLVVDDKSPLAFAQAVTSVTGQPSVAGRLREAGRRRAHELSPGAIGDKWVRAIDDAVAVRAAGATRASGTADTAGAPAPLRSLSIGAP